jgi:UDP-2,4-diacetamido-2,4,6-trideoxy-beta-L-altropyranose hydrolase
MAEPARVLLLPASGPGVGGGHVLRCLALAAALREAGAACAFAAAPEGLRLLSRFGQSLGKSLDVQAIARDAPLAELADAYAANAVVIDDYGVDAAGEAGLATPTRLLAAVDDLANRPHAATLLIDPSQGRDPAAYASLLPPGARVLAGPAYALLRPAFVDAAPISVRPKVGRVFVGFGLADPGGITARAVEVLLMALPDVAFDVAVGGAAQSLPALQALAVLAPRLHLHVEAPDVAGLMARADMAVGAGGGSTWERARLGLPSVCVIVADNQRELARDLAAEGAQLTLEAGDPAFDAVLAAAACRLAMEADLRARLSQNSRALCDGQGARRAARAILQAAAALHPAP